MKTIFEKLKIFLARVVQMAPCDVANFETVDHNLSPRIFLRCKTKQKKLKKKLYYSKKTCCN